MLHVYPIILQRIVKKDGRDEEILISQRKYVHKKDFTGFIGIGEGRKIGSILEKIAEKQPENVSDAQAEEYFDNQMRKKGFEPAKISRNAVELRCPYIYKVR